MSGWASLNENHYLRKCYFKREQVPTQSVMMNKMTPPLAKVYFKSMTPKLKVLAGLEPSLKGGGNDWYMPPEEILKGRAILKPVKKEYLRKLGFDGIEFYSHRIVRHHNREMEKEQNQMLMENDRNWMLNISVTCQQLAEETAREAARENTTKISTAFNDFSIIFTSSTTKIETLLFDAAVKEIERVREDAFQMMMNRYETLLKQQATMLYDKYTNMLMNEKARLKQEFIDKVETARTDMSQRLNKINHDKHVAVEKLRYLLECQNLACQVYVALREREECQKEMEITQHEHKKQMKAMKEQLQMKDLEINVEIEKKLKRDEFNKIWKQKVCHVVKHFQTFVAYCLQLLPEHADFFIDMEKLMLLQLEEALENPSEVSIFVAPPEGFHTPIPKPHPFYIFRDVGHKYEFDQDLCPHHCTSSASQFPVIVVNKKCIYAKCDNFENCADRISHYIVSNRWDDEDLKDAQDPEIDVPVTYTASTQLAELKLESSLMQILQSEMPNVQNVSTECCSCKLPYCFCSPTKAKELERPKVIQPVEEPKPVVEIPSGSKITTREAELEHVREPNLKSYMQYVQSKKCRCGKMSKKHLKEHLPPYMRNTSKFTEPLLPKYEPCSVADVIKMVKKAQGKRTPPPTPPEPEPTHRDVATQYEDVDYEFLCNCLSDQELDNWCKELIRHSTMFTDIARPSLKVLSGSVTPSYLTKKSSVFAQDMAFSLRHLVEESPELKELFKKTTCDYDAD